MPRGRRRRGCMRSSPAARDRRRPVRALLALALLALLAPAVDTRAQAARDEVYALVGGRVVTVAGPPIEKGTDVLRDGLIEAVGVSITVPTGARVIDASGMTVTPGIIDGYGGIGLPAPRGTAAGGGAGASPAAGLLAPQALTLERVRV